ncbi:ATP synthase subunit O, mitochondrial-like isoform X6 [Cucurbita pepo subsp. pepo]|uniref:ATP synthase subunit O, mitochondrial-like isoform X5 n=1 Tax=Cucurbita pepo subsp. pepo TaxID=3664 RepID=UPI000C9D5D2D|nr:ATP synthase subunit O, mitochondrial-like isoform X5 [Cucurbita pepo subsp. pepo]XP_023525832.1 ATP synthase subunit O, mitochondrial-like isoform X6 [Cucurbita pepo subsp. pepo]
MALASRLRSTIPVLSKFLRSESSCTPVLLSRTYAATSGKHEQKVKFTMDLSVPAETRVKAIDEISAEAKFSEVVKNFLVVLAENGRLRYIDSIAKRFLELTMAHKGEVKAAVTTVIPIPPQEENELKETLQDIIGQGKKVKLEQKIDPSILGGLIVEFDEKVFDMSIKTRARQLERFLRQPVSLDGL